VNRELLINLHQVEEFKLLLKEIRARRPVIPQYDPNTQNTEHMKVASVQQTTFDLILGIMSPWGEAEV
jgi:hypothetical protein